MGIVIRMLIVKNWTFLTSFTEELSTSKLPMAQINGTKIKYIPTFKS